MTQRREIDVAAPAMKRTVIYHRYPFADARKRGEKVCAWCGVALTGRRTKWCSDDCRLRYFISCGSPGYMRIFLHKRDKGICANCRCDTEFIDDFAWQLRKEYGQEYRGFYLDRIGIDDHRTSLWDADHIIPIIEGGSHSPENLQTLCTPCHKEDTASLRRRLSQAGRKEAEQVKLF